jgi:hypothetical protein
MLAPQTNGKNKDKRTKQTFATNTASPRRAGGPRKQQRLWGSTQANTGKIHTRGNRDLPLQREPHGLRQVTYKSEGKEILQTTKKQQHKGKIKRQASTYSKTKYFERHPFRYPRGESQLEEHDPKAALVADHL